MTVVMDRPIRRSSWHKIQKFLVPGVAVLTVILLAVAFLGTAERSVRVPAASITIARVDTGSFHDFVPLRGAIVPRDTIDIDAVSGGQVKRVLVEPGDIVTAGQPLVEFGNTGLQLTVIQQEGGTNQSMAQLQQNEIALEQNKIANDRALAQIDYDIARLTRSLQRRGALAAKGYTSPEAKDLVEDELEYDRRLRPLQAASNERQELLRDRLLPQIHEQLEQAKKNLEVVRGKLDDLVEKAHVAGRVTDIALNIGDNVNPGQRIATITPDTGFKVSADVDEYYLGRIRDGQTAELDLAGKILKLKVFRVRPQVKNGTFTIDLAFDGATPAGLLPGQAVQGKLSLGDDAQATIVPAGAFLERTGGDWIFALAADGRSANRRRIKIGRRNADQAEVLTGLAVGERAIVSDYTGLDRIDRIDITN
ncbi:MAG: transporter permease [Rhodospirillales bacterium]|nr:transporter permease [Rhodospirillales bacterium]